MHRDVFGRVLFLFLLLAPTGLYAEKSLHWRRLDVEARLDAAGVLRVAERQAIVFTGDWNGGERTFRLANGQSLKLLKVSRQDDSGTMRELKRGNLSELDHYEQTDARTVRWRSRLPSDPPFDGTEILYELDYELSGILTRAGNSYLLDHDFAFPDRSGTIEAFSLSLTLDPAWKPDLPVPAKIEQGPLPPGRSVVVSRKLEFQGPGRPTSARAGTSRGESAVLFLLLLVAVLGMGVSFYRRESALGRFAPLPPLEDINAAWLEKNVFTLRPEEVGALWDEKIGAPEVAAVLARLSAEKKIATAAEGKKLTMRLLVPLSELAGYEKDLLEAFFFGGRKETDTDAVREHYRSKGFDPASKIKGTLEERLASHPDFRDLSAPPSRWPTAVLLLSGIALMVLSVLFFGADTGLLVGTVVSQGLLWGIAFVPALFFQKRMHRFLVPSLGFLWLPAVLLYAAYRAIGSGAPVPILALVGIFLTRVAIVNNLFNIAKTRSGPHRIVRRKTLLAAREFFARELTSPHPRLEDSWFPYVVAFGLASGAEKWFRAYGGQQSAAAGISRAGGASSSSGSAPAPSGGWTGGGGSFGGAGASASWATAAGALAAGVSAPSSGGSGGGGGGGGGGSSGGGGGGGW